MLVVKKFSHHQRAEGLRSAGKISRNSPAGDRAAPSYVNHEAHAGGRPSPAARIRPSPELLLRVLTLKTIPVLELSGFSKASRARSCEASLVTKPCEYAC